MRYPGLYDVQHSSFLSNQADKVFQTNMNYDQFRMELEVKKKELELKIEQKRQLDEEKNKQVKRQSELKARLKSLEENKKVTVKSIKEHEKKRQEAERSFEIAINTPLPVIEEKEDFGNLIDIEKSFQFDTYDTPKLGFTPKYFDPELFVMSEDDDDVFYCMHAYGDTASFKLLKFKGGKQVYSIDHNQSDPVHLSAKGNLVWVFDAFDSCSQRNLKVTKYDFSGSRVNIKESFSHKISSSLASEDFIYLKRLIAVSNNDNFYYLISGFIGNAGTGDVYVSLCSSVRDRPIFQLKANRYRDGCDSAISSVDIIEIGSGKVFCLVQYRPVIGNPLISCKEGHRPPHAYIISSESIEMEYDIFFPDSIKDIENKELVDYKMDLLGALDREKSVIAIYIRKGNSVYFWRDGLWVGSVKRKSLPVSHYTLARDGRLYFFHTERSKNVSQNTLYVTKSYRPEMSKNSASGSEKLKHHEQEREEAISIAMQVSINVKMVETEMQKKQLSYEFDSEITKDEVAVVDDQVCELESKSSRLSLEIPKLEEEIKKLSVKVSRQEQELMRERNIYEEELERVSTEQGKLSGFNY